MELATAVGILRRWWLFVLLGVVGLALGYVVSASSPRRYESVVTLQLNPAARGALVPYAADQNDYNPVVTLAATYNEVLRSRTFAQSVVNQLQLSVPPAAVAGAISSRLVPNTNVLRLTVSWSNPDDAQQLAQGIAATFLSENARRQGVEPGQQSSLQQMEETARGYPARIDVLRKQRDQLDQLVARGDLARLTELNNLDTRLAALESSYASLLVEINRARSGVDTATILDVASPARATGSIPAQQAMVFGLVAALVVAAGLAQLLRQMDDRVRTPEDLVTATGSAPLTAVGRITTKGGKRVDADSGLVAVWEPRGASAEAFRILTANLRFAASDQPIRTVVVTSASPGEGKTLVSCNLAVTLAQAGARVLLVDGDLRRPNVHKAFGIANEHGLADALLETATAAGEAASWGLRTSARGGSAAVSDNVPGVVPSGVENLSLLPAGRMPSNPGAVLGSGAATRLMERLQGMWDIVLFDTAPVGLISDTLMLAAHADAIILVARSGRTRRSQLVRASESLKQTGRTLLGIVLNDFRITPLARYYGGYSSYYYYAYTSHYYATAANGSNGHAAEHSEVPPADKGSLAR